MISATAAAWLGLGAQTVATGAAVSSQQKAADQRILQLENEKTQQRIAASEASIARMDQSARAIASQTAIASAYGTGTSSGYRGTVSNEAEAMNRDIQNIDKKTRINEYGIDSAQHTTKAKANMDSAASILGLGKSLFDVVGLKGKGL